MTASAVKIYTQESVATSADLRESTRDSSYRIRELVYAATQAENNISLVYKETLRSILSLFSSFKIIDYENKAQSIKCIHANPERPIAKLIQEDNIILPIISVAQPSSAADTKKTKYVPLIVTESVWDDRAQRARRVVSLVPRPLNIKYKITLMTKYKSDLDQLSEQIYLLFNPSTTLITRYANNVKVIMNEETPEGSMEVSDREDRVLVKGFNITVETYVPTPKFIFSSTGQIERFYNDVKLTEDIV